MWALYLQNQVMAFLFVKVMQNPEISLNLRDFGPNFASDHQMYLLTNTC